MEVVWTSDMRYVPCIYDIYMDGWKLTKNFQLGEPGVVKQEAFFNN